jgi:hypothetical protein
MKTMNKSSYLDHVSAFLIAVSLASTYPVEAADSWQERMLFKPSVSQLELEKRGRVMIYDGMTRTQVARAMDSQFDRIESMMFVRTIATDSKGEILRNEETGDVVVEDDGC